MKNYLTGIYHKRQDIAIVTRMISKEFLDENL